MGFGMYGEAEVEVDMTLTPPEITRADFIAIYAGSVTGMCTHLCMCVLYVCMYVCMYVCVYVCIHINVCMHSFFLRNYHACM